MALTHDRFQWQALKLVALNLPVPLLRYRMTINHLYIFENIF
jgi:hypothetical protein